MPVTTDLVSAPFPARLRARIAHEHANHSIAPGAAAARALMNWATVAIPLPVVGGRRGRRGVRYCAPATARRWSLDRS